jgi:hypothetical protein
MSTGQHRAAGGGVHIHVGDSLSGGAREDRPLGRYSVRVLPNLYNLGKSRA